MVFCFAASKGPNADYLKSAGEGLNRTRYAKNGLVAHLCGMPECPRAKRSEQGIQLAWGADKDARHAVLAFCALLRPCLTVFSHSYKVLRGVLLEVVQQTLWNYSGDSGQRCTLCCLRPSQIGRSFGKVYPHQAGFLRLQSYLLLLQS